MTYDGRRSAGVGYLSTNLARRVQRGVGHAAHAELARLAGSAARRGVRGGTGAVEDFTAAMATEVGNRSDLAAKHKAVAETVRRALITSYNRNVAARKISKPALRQRNRYTRRLGPLMPRMVHYDWVGIYILDLALLKKEAPHWARLNFGAQPAPKARQSVRLTKPRRFPLIFDGRQIGRVGFDPARWGPRAPFYLPRGYWQSWQYQVRGTKTITTERGVDRRIPDRDPTRTVPVHRGFKTQPESTMRFRGASQNVKTTGALADNKLFARNAYMIPSQSTRRSVATYRSYRSGFRRSTDEFHPRGPVPLPSFPTRGIASTQFVDAGFAALADALPKAYADLVDHWVERARRGARSSERGTAR